MRSSSLPIALSAAALVAGLAGAATTAHAGKNKGIAQIESTTSFDFGVINAVGFVFETSLGWDRWELRGGMGFFNYNDGSGEDASDLALRTRRLDAHVRYNLLQTRCRKCGKHGMRFSNWVEAGIGRKSVELYDRHGTAFSNNVIEDGVRPEFSVGVGVGMAMRGAFGLSLATRWNTAPATHAEKMLMGGGPVSSYMVMFGVSFNPL